MARGRKAAQKEGPTNQEPEGETSKTSSGKVNEASSEHNISMSELLDIIETKAKQMFEEQIGKLRSEVKSLNEQVTKLSKDRDAQKQQNDKLWFEINKRVKENQELKMKLDALEQDTKMNNLRIVNFS